MITMSHVKRFLNWCREPSRIKVSNVKRFSILRDLDKNDYLIAYSVLILLFVSLINWNLYSWLFLVAIMLLIVEWYSTSNSTKDTT